jgi:hypothetical protein
MRCIWKADEGVAPAWQAFVTAPDTPSSGILNTDYLEGRSLLKKFAPVRFTSTNRAKTPLI